MNILHDSEYYNEIVDTLRQTHTNLDALAPKISNIIDLIYGMNLAGASTVFENAIDDLEVVLTEKYLDDLQVLITAIDGNNVEMVDLDNRMKNEVEGD